MIIVIKQGADDKQIENFIEELSVEYDVQITEWFGSDSTVLGLSGDTALIDIENIQAHSIVESVSHVTEPYKKANRKFHPDNTVIKVGNVTIGDGSLTMIAGPCSVESSEQINEIAKEIKASGADILRAGAFKPRTSPTLSKDFARRAYASCLKQNAIAAYRLLQRL